MYVDKLHVGLEAFESLWFCITLSWREWPEDTPQKSGNLPTTQSPPQQWVDPPTDLILAPMNMDAPLTSVPRVPLYLI